VKSGYNIFFYTLKASFPMFSSEKIDHLPLLLDSFLFLAFFAAFKAKANTFNAFFVFSLV